MLDKANILTKVIDAGGRLTVHSALNPVLWLCAIVTIPSLIISSMLTSIPLWLICLICSPVAIASVGFIFLLLFDRDKLQSEDYQIRKKSLEIIEQKGDKHALMLRTDSVNAIANPDVKKRGETNKDVHK
jgi:hypothetical protein